MAKLHLKSVMEIFFVLQWCFVGSWSSQSI